MTDDAITTEPLTTALIVGAQTTVFVWAAIILSVITVVAITTLAIFRPENTSTGTIILGITLPTITGCMAKAIHEGQKSVDGRLSQLLMVTAKASKAEGQLQATQQRRPARAADVLNGVVPNPIPVRVEVVNQPLATTIAPKKESK